MGSKRCPFCIAKDDEIARLHRLILKLSERPLSAPVPSGAGAIATTMRSLAEQGDEAGEESTLPGAIPVASFIDQFNAVHGDDAWASLAQLPARRAAE